jgi:hypothetical protein
MKKPSSKNKEVIKESQEEAFIIVNETVIGKPKEEIKQVKVRPFVTDTARIEIHAKRHIPLGANLGGATVAVTMSVPCYVEELSACYQKTDAIVDKIIAKKVDTILASLNELEV